MNTDKSEEVLPMRATPDEVFQASDTYAQASEVEVKAIRHVAMAAKTVGDFLQEHGVDGFEPGEELGVMLHELRSKTVIASMAAQRAIRLSQAFELAGAMAMQTKEEGEENATD